MNDLIPLVLNSSLVAKIILAILFLLSVISWGIIIEKFFMFRRVIKENKKFSHLFTMRIKWSDRMVYSREFKSSPIAKIFRNNFNEIKLWLERSHKSDELQANIPPIQEPKKQRIPMKELFEVGIAEELSLLEKHLVFLGTTVSVSPFLGLLGTVWGIMTSFLSMGMRSSAEIAAVGPGIAEALITTIAGLAVAIPALVGHNYFVNKLRQILNEVDNFFISLMISVKKERSL
ncbi:MotA/TolQ/ExbB proton channel family protein [candidate division KSB1 bacterium]|nr:MotA/TolQ/ExbB proton channel family protein [candidate division KSB1 bacterium]